MFSANPVLDTQLRLYCGDKGQQDKNEDIDRQCLLGDCPAKLAGGLVTMPCIQVFGIHAIRCMGVRMGVMARLVIREMKMHGECLHTDHHQQQADDKVVIPVCTMLHGQLLSGGLLTGIIAQ